MSADSTIFVLLIVVLLPLLGGLLALTPWLMRKNECFTVSIPESAQLDAAIVHLKKIYTVQMAIFTIIFTALVVLFMIFASYAFAMVAFTISSIALILISFLLMLSSRSHVRAIKVARGWKAKVSRRSAVIAEKEMPQPVNMSWELLHIPVIALTLAIGLLGYASAPDRIPMHIDLAGNVNGWADKSYGSILFPVLMQLFFVLVFAFSHWSITRSKRVSDPDTPVSSAYSYGLFARAQSIFIVVLGVACNLSLICMEFAMVGKMTIMRSVVPLMVVVLVSVAGAVVLSVIYGQAGSRLMGRMDSSDAMPADEDKYWKLGIFYVNPDDSSLFVPDRFGVGWTNNFGRLTSWVIVVGFVVITIAFILITTTIA